MRRPDAYNVYLFLSFAEGILFAALFGIPYYETVTAGFNPLQLVIIGVAKTLSMLLFEIPTGVVADVYSRRLSIIIGLALIGLSLLVEGLFPYFAPILLAQMVWGLGYTFTSGATQAWISDEIGEERANRAFLTANRYDLSGNVVGILAAMALGSLTSVAVMILVSSAGWLVLAALLVLLMPERGFQPVKSQERNSFQHMIDTFRKGVGIVRLRPALLAILGVGLFYGTTAGFDRLWVWHLVDRFTLPALFGNNSLSFFGALNLAGILLSIVLTRRVEKRFDALEPQRVGRLIFVVTSAIALSIAGFACAPLLGLALGFYLSIYSLLELIDPLLNAWMNQRLDPDVRATIFSMIAQTGAVGQVAGSLVVGVLANSVSAALALVICGGLLTPALGLIVRANRTHARPAPETLPAAAPTLLPPDP